MSFKTAHRKLKRTLKKLGMKISKARYDTKKEKNTFKIEEVNKIVFLMYRNKIGDTLVSTIMYRELKRQYPNIEIAILTKLLNREVLKDNPYVDKVYFYEENKSKRKKVFEEIKKEKYDLLVNIDDLVFKHSMEVVKEIEAKVNLGFGKEDYNSYDFTFESMEKNYPFHETDKCKKVLSLFNIEKPSLDYDIFLNEEEEDKAKQYIKSLEKDFVVCLNRYGANKHRTFNEENMLAFLEKISKLNKNIAILLLCPPNKKQETLNLIKKSKLDNVFYPEIVKSIRDSAALVKFSDLTISPETSIVHLASTFKKKQIAIFRDKTTKDVWAPLDKNSKMIVVDSRKDVNFINIDEFERILKEIVKE